MGREKKHEEDEQGRLSTGSDLPDSDSLPTSAADETRQTSIGFSQFAMNHPFRIANVESMKRAARDMDVRLLITNADSSTKQEIANIKRLIERKVDAVIVSSGSGPAVYDGYRAIAAAGLPLVIFASGVPKDDSVPYTSYVATDEVEMGRQAGEYVVRRIGGSGRIVILEGIVESTNNQLRLDGLLPVLKSAPGIVIVRQVSAKWLRRPAQKAMSEVLGTGVGIDAVLALNDEMALGAIDALRRARLAREVFVVGLDGQKEALQAIHAGGPFVMTIKNEWDGKEALRIAIDAALGHPVPRRIVLDGPMIVQTNVEDYLTP